MFERPYKKETGASLVVTYHHRFHNLSVIISKHFTFSYAKRKVKTVFTAPPFVSFRFGYSLKKHLAIAKVYPLIREKGTFCCGKADVKLVAT